MSLDEKNRYLSDNFGPVVTEETLSELDVEGTIPAYLDGRYLRNGPNPMGGADHATYHWFTGAGMVHGLRLRDGRAEWYRNRWVRSGDVADALGEKHHPGPIHAGMDFAANTNVIGHGGRTFAIVEGGSRPYELTEQLDTIGPCDFDGTLTGGYTAHPHRDPSTGELHALSYFWGWGDRVEYSVLDVDGRVRHTVELEVPGAPMLHDFSLTAEHVVLYDLPVTFDLEVAARGLPFPYRWNESHPSRVGVFRRDGDGSDLRWYGVEPCYVYHPMNAFTDGGRVVLDVVRHPSTMRMDATGPFDGSPTLDRWTVDLAGDTVVESRLDDRPLEFPRIDERRAGQRNRYGYSPTSTTGADPVFDGLQRIDLDTGATVVRSFGPACSTSEFVFVPSSASSAEDDGTLLGFVHDGTDDSTRLALLDAATLDDVASVHLPVRIPYGFHGNWVPTTG